nr:hypothetical protein [uncultured Prevotella sp.]
MKQNKIKSGYQKPQTEIMSINSESSLLYASIHSQHNPGRRRTGPSASNAKEEVEWLEVGDETSSNNNHTSLWED